MDDYSCVDNLMKDIWEKKLQNVILIKRILPLLLRIRTFLQ